MGEEHGGNGFRLTRRLLPYESAWTEGEAGDLTRCALPDTGDCKGIRRPISKGSIR